MSNFLRGSVYKIRNSETGETSLAICIGKALLSGDFCFRLQDNIFGNRPASAYSQQDTVHALVQALDVENFPFWTYARGPHFSVESSPHTAAAPCHCQSLFAGHDESCFYHKPDRYKGLGMKSAEPKTRAEINAEHLTKNDSPGFGFVSAGKYYVSPKGTFK